ncbi:MAG: FecR domain-containing protein [Tannerella sp.]|jgi:ferric-dicitrate binding protein FerR (iron transport regulator)|nr:FecR domain-containing protein [Tannerella sp.]
MDELIKKYGEGSLSQEEKLELLRKSENDAALKTELARYKNLNAIMNLKRQEGDLTHARESYRQFMNGRKSGTVSLRQILSYAAVAACLIGFTWFLSGIYHQSKSDSAEKFNTLYVPAGQRVNFTLEDGTSVWLNAQTKLTYPVEFKGNKRHVQVEGEAYFEVAKNPEKPFIVSSKGFNIKVLGTTFNIYSYPGEKLSRVSLIEGRVTVDNKDVVTLKPQEEVTIEGDKMTVAPIADRNYFLWTEGIYSFNNERFENIVKKLELYYDINIHIENVAMREWRYTVKFRQRDGIDEILQLMQRIHRFEIQKDEDNNRIKITK